MTTPTQERTLTELDHARLLGLLRRDLHHSGQGDRSNPQRRAIEDLLDTSALVPSRQVAPEVVTMNSTVLLQHAQTRQHSQLRLCYPADAQPTQGDVSVLSPVGSALLGLRVGDVARWSSPAGGDGMAEILAIVSQPESRGDYTV